MATTVKDVAKAADVSIGTVSRVLSGELNVPAATTARVMKAVEELGYSRLRKRKTLPADRQLDRKNVALLLIGMDRSLVALPSVASGIHGAESAISGAGGNVLLSDIPYANEIPKTFASQQLHGLLAKGALQGELIKSADSNLIQRLRKIPTVWFLGRPKTADWGDVVESNDAEVGRLAAEYLLSKGHKRIAVLNPKPGHATLDQRGASFTWHVNQAGGKVENIFGKKTEWQLPLRTVNESGSMDKLVSKLLKRRNRPTAVFCPADSITAMVYRAFSKRGLLIGRDMSLLSCNNELPLLTGLYPEVTTIDICAEQIGRQAVDQLIWRLGHPAAPSVTVSVQPQLIEGMSVANLTRNK